VPESANRPPSLVQPNKERVHAAASYVLFLDAKKDALYSMTRDLNLVINDGILSFDEVFERWSRSCLAKAYVDVEVRHLGMMRAGRGLSANDNNATDEIKKMLLQDEFTIYYEHVTQAIASKITIGESLQEKIKRI
jgi:hypothetical protein